MSLRVIGGAFRGRPLKVPKNHLTRPTTAIVRKSLFDICKEEIEGANVLDLFAGSGAVGIEALSRGAAHVTFVDADRRALLCIEENVKKLGLEGKATLHLGDAYKILERLEKFQHRFDLIYIDPPYGEKQVLGELLLQLDGLTLAHQAKIFVEEAHPSQLFNENLALNHFQHRDSRKFGRSLLHQFVPLRKQP